MKTQKDDIDAYVDALRGDLPSERDEARVRARLLASGVLVAASTVTSGVAAAGSTGAVGGLGSAPAGLVKVGLLSKVIALPLAAKVGAATTVAVALAAGVPIAFEAEVAATAPTSRAMTAPPSESRTSPAVAPTERRMPPAMPALQSAPAPEVSEPLAVAPRPMVGAITRPAAILPAPPAPTPLQAPAAGRVATAEPAQARSPAELAPVLAPEPAPALAVGPAHPDQPSPSTLAEETRLMERAMAALGAGDRDDAGYWLAEHERRFPQGLLARERLRTLARLRQSAASHDPAAPAP